jgi:hypothetical protein
VQLAECVGDATPVGLRFGRPALYVRHHDQTACEISAVRGRDRHRHRHPFTVEVSQQLGFPREVDLAALAEPTDGELPVDAHAPHFVDASASERIDPSDVVTPLIECLPSHTRHLRGTSSVRDGCWAVDLSPMAERESRFSAAPAFWNVPLNGRCTIVSSWC